MYFGKRREMLPYFAFIEYPCPAYKNPSDYYRKCILILIIILLFTRKYFVRKELLLSLYITTITGHGY
jgi:hypothetical protein